MNLEEQLRAIQDNAKADPDAAILQLRDLLKGNNDLLTGLYVNGSIAFLSGQYQDAAALFAQIIDVDAKNEPASRYLFHSYWQAGDQVNALEEIKRYWQIWGAQHESDLANEYRRIVKEIRSNQSV